MKIENIIRRVLREEQEEEKLLKIPSIRTFNNDWNVLQKYLEFRGNPKYSIGGDLKLRESDIKTLGNLVRVGGNLDLYGCEKLQSLGELKYVGGLLGLHNTKIETLGNLEYVGGDLDIYNTTLSKKYTEEVIRDMVEVVGNIFMEDDED